MRDIAYPPVVGAVKVGFKVLGQRLTITGGEHIPRTGGVLLAFNHISYVDFIYGGFAAQSSKRLVRYMAKRELFDHRAMGPLMRSLHHIEVDRGAGVASYNTAVDYLSAGEAVGIFPEATISRSMELKDFKSGAARIAADAGVPIVPVILWGTQRIKTKDHPRDLSRGKPISISVGEALRPTGVDAVAESRQLQDRMSTMLDTTIAEYADARLAPGAWWTPASHGGSAPSAEEAERLDAQEKRDRAARRAARRREQS